MAAVPVMPKIQYEERDSPCFLEREVLSERRVSFEQPVAKVRSAEEVAAMERSIARLEEAVRHESARRAEAAKARDAAELRVLEVENRALSANLRQLDAIRALEQQVGTLRAKNARLAAHLARARLVAQAPPSLEEMRLEDDLDLTVDRESEGNLDSYHDSIDLLDGGDHLDAAGDPRDDGQGSDGEDSDGGDSDASSSEAASEASFAELEAGDAS